MNKPSPVYFFRLYLHSNFAVMLLKIYEENPSQKALNQVVEILQSGGLVIVPTDSLYSISCNLGNKKAVERLAQLKGIKLKDANFTFIFNELSSVAEYVKPLPNSVFKLIKRNTPGPFTFILETGSNIPSFFRKSKKTIGVRIPDNKIVRSIVKLSGAPLLVTSVHADDPVQEYMTDPSLIHEKYVKTVDLVIDGGYGQSTATTVVDCTKSEISILRQGNGHLSEI